MSKCQSCILAIGQPAWNFRALEFNPTRPMHGHVRTVEFRQLAGEKRLKTGLARNQHVRERADRGERREQKPSLNARASEAACLALKAAHCAGANARPAANRRSAARSLGDDGCHVEPTARADDRRAIPAGASHAESVTRGRARVPGVSALEDGNPNGFWRGPGPRARADGR
jgi:hypothetical protein